MRVLVTGGAGFIGSHLCRRLTTTPPIERVIALDDLSTGIADNLARTDVELIVGSILDHDALRSVIRGVDAIVHLAARPSVARSVDDPITSHVVNATGTIEVLEAARSTGAHVIVASSSSVYGATSTLPKSEGLPTRPMSPYAASKLAAESYSSAYAHSYAMDTLALRFFNVFGPRQSATRAYAAVIPAFVDAALRGRPLTVFGDGRQSRDFTYVDTVTAVLADAVARRVADVEPVNLAFGTRTDLLTLIGLLEALLGRRLEVCHRPARAGDAAHSQADGRRLRQMFPDMAPTSLVDGLAATVAWMRSVTRA